MQRNLNILIGIILLAIAATWVTFNNVDYSVPEGITASEDENAPWWYSFLFWQGESQRSIKVHQGLDLVGGSQVVLEAEKSADLTEAELEELSSVMEAARVVVENRVSGGLGVVEPLVQLGGNDRIIVELPDVDDPDLAVSLLKETGHLEFVEVLRLPVEQNARILTSDFLARTDEEVITETYAYGGQIFNTIMTGQHLQDANVGFDQFGARYIGFTLTEEGREIFSQYTSAHVGDFLAITLDGFVLSAPRIQTAITTREGQITSGDAGGFAREEAEDIAIKLKYGALPVPLKVVENRTIGPTLGAESVERSIRAGAIGLIVVLLFLFIYYRIPGFLAALALALYAVMNFALYKLIPVTITVPAITGFILSIGMAVDANILVFERLKEELRSGRKLRNAAEAGFSRAWPSIRDANLSTLITCFILFWFGSNFGASIVKGFAVTLAIGVVVNLFTAVTVTRALVRFTVNTFGSMIEGNMALWLGLKKGDTEGTLPNWVKNSFQLVQKRRYFYIFSTLIIIPGIIIMGVSFAQFGSPLKLSIDYLGGTLWEMKFDQNVAPLDLRDVFIQEGYTDTSAQSVQGENIILVRTKELSIEEKEILITAINSKFNSFEERRFESIGPTLGEEVTQASSTAVGIASLAILLFIWYAFRAIANPFRYGISAIIAMLHDILITAGLFSLAGLVWGWEVDTLFLTAILTVIGYSVNDTIVVFDRLRENLPKRRLEPFDVVANRSLLETLHRSLATSISTLFVVGAVWAFGGATTQQFMAIMFVGIASGAYSSIFNAVPILVSWQQGDLKQTLSRSKTA